MTLVTNPLIETEADVLSVALHRLRAEVMGRVITAEDADYDAIREWLNLEVVRRPAVIVRPVDAMDVSRVVLVARESGLELAIRSGGHSLSGFSTLDGGIVLDLSQMKGIEINVEERTAWAETGLTAGEVTTATSKHGLVVGFGDTASVGIGGITTGGGIGYLVRKYGLTIDNVLAARVVTADGQIRHVDAETHPDLFWAIRGGGSNVGVVTHFKYRLYAVDMIYGGMLVLPARADVIAAFAALAEAAPEELSTIVMVMPAPPLPFVPPELIGQVVVLATMAYTGDLEEGERVIAPFRKLAEPIMDMLGPMPYPQIYMAEMDGPRMMTAFRSKFIDQIDEPTAQLFLDQVKASTAPMPVVQFRILGGAMARVPAEATAFAHRSARAVAAFMALYMDPAEAPVHEAWAANALAAHQQDAGVYVNFVGNEDVARVKDAYPSATQERLAEIKAKYDPTNFFRRNHNIAPKAK